MNDRKHAVTSVVVALLGVLLLLVASGCSSASTDSEEPGAPDPTADSPLMAEVRQSAEATKNLTSAHLVIKSTGQNDAMLGIASADIDVRSNPLAANGSSTYKDQTNVPFRIKDDVIAVKLFDDWTTLASVSDLSASKLIDPTRGVADILSGITNVQLQGTAVVDGIPTKRITATIPKNVLKSVDAAAKGSARATVWIADDGTHRLVQAQMDRPDQSIEIMLSKWNEQVNLG